MTLARALSRRRFVQGSLAALALGRWPRIRRPCDELRVAVVGLNGRGVDHVEALRALAGVRIVALCDVDELVLAREARKLRERGQRAALYVDFRQVLESGDVDAVALATPNHWHALQTVWACQAGKDVYVEKPVTHAFLEGQHVIAAARKHGRIVQAGLQSRSSPPIQAAIEWLHAGNLGPVELARALCYKPRPPIGKTRGNQKIPDSVDYDLWCGPAPLAPLQRSRLHYDWHWFFETGDGDLGNQGVHQMDVALWALGAQGLPVSVTSIGARLGYDDDGETPNTQVVYYAFEPAPLVFEVRGLPRDSAAQAGDWAAGMDDYLGQRIGVAVHCQGGTLRLSSAMEAIACDAEGKEVQRWPAAEVTPGGSGDHFANWIEACKSRRAGDLSAEIELGERSSALVHLGNASHRVGLALPQESIRAEAQSSSVLSEACERMLAHLSANGVDLAKAKLTMGPCLVLDPTAACFQDHERANALLRGSYRAPYGLPETV